MVAKIETVNISDKGTAVIRVFLSANRSVEVDADIERAKLPLADREDGVKIAAQLTDELQAKLDVRVLLRSMPGNDSDKTVDPARGDLFWQDIDGDRYLVSREGIVTVTWGRFVNLSGVAVGDTKYLISWRQAKR